MYVNLPQDVDQFVRDLLVTGRFTSEEAVVEEGLRLLKSREQFRAEVANGFKQLDDGDWFDGNVVFDELNATIDAIEAEKRGI